MDICIIFLPDLLHVYLPVCSSICMSVYSSVFLADSLNVLSGTEGYWQTERWKDKDRQMERQTERWKDKDRQMERQTKTDTWKDKQKDRQLERQTVLKILMDIFSCPFMYLWPFFCFTNACNFIPFSFFQESFGLRQANLVLIAYVSSEGSGEPAHPRSLARTFAARSYKQGVKRNLQTESQIPGPSEWLGMRS